MASPSTPEQPTFARPMTGAHGSDVGPEQIAARLRIWEENGGAPRISAPEGPLTLELYPTLACNLACRFCDVTLRHQPPVNELSAARLLEIVDEAADLGARRVFVLGGGEPLLRKDATPLLLRRIKEHGMEGILTTNATLLDKKLTEQLCQTGWDEVHISIDGPNAAIHDRLRGQRGAFKRAVQAACRLAVARRSSGRVKPKVALHFVLTNQNHHTLVDMVRLGASLDVFRIDFDALIAYRPEQQALQLDAAQRQEVVHIASQALSIAKELGIETTLANFQHLERLDRGNTRPEAGQGSGLASAPCLKAWHYLVVQADGRTSPCCVLAGEGGSVAERPVAEVWRSDRFLAQVRQTMIDGKAMARCRECSWNILSHEAEIREHLENPPISGGS